MDIDELRDKAALAAFQFLLEQSDYKDSKFIDIDLLSDNAWELADRFINHRGDKCHGCPHKKSSVDKMMEEAMASGHMTDQGAGPRSLRDSTKKKPRKK